jgi:LPXTG-site transpeptidase (sortase) family protein
VAALVLAVVAVVLLVASRGGGGDRAAGAAPAAVTSTGAPTPYRLVVRSLHIDAPVVSIAMTKDRVLDPPANASDVGWWNASARPGATHGQTIVTGHTVHTGGGQFDHLGTIAKGARIELSTPQGEASYVATKVFTLSKPDVAARTTELFGQARKHNRLVLITCGDWTGREYLTNVFVYATPVAPSTAA